MADDKRKRGDQQQGGPPQGSPDRQRNKDRKPGTGMESPDSGRTPTEEDDEQQE